MKGRLALLPVALAIVACQNTPVPTNAGEAVSASVAPEPRLIVREPERVYPGRVLARFTEGVRAEDVAPAYGLSVERHGRGNTFVVLRGAAAGNERAVAARLSADARVVYAEPDWLRQPTAINSKLWAFYNPGGLQIFYTRGPSNGQPVSSFLSTADADEDNSENYAASGGNVEIGSIDTGVDFSHPEFLAGQLIAGQDWYSGDNDPTDEDGHGTHTTGTMVGQTVGVAGVAGAGPHVQVLVQRVCGPMGCPTSAIVSAIYAAADSGVVAMNLSLGGSSESQSEKDAIASAWSQNALVIASAGNDGTSTVSCPACDPLAISVGATNWQDGLTYYTNWGNGLDITAPGGQMYSNTTEESGIYSAWPGGGYRYLQGTSMSAPQVTGTAAVVASMNTSLRGLSLRQRLLTTTDDLGSGGWDTNYGCGRLNSYRAVKNANFDGNNTVFTGSPCNADPSGGSTPPPSLTSSFTYTCGGTATCTFDGSGSTNATTYAWNFGDGGTATGKTPTHSYSADGRYTVTLTTGDGSSTATSSKTVSCRTNKRTGTRVCK